MGDGGWSSGGPHPTVAGDWLRPRLDAARGRVVGVGARAAYVEMDAGGDGAIDGGGTSTGSSRPAWMLAIETHQGVGLPCGLRLTAPDAGLMAHLHPGAAVTVHDGRVVVAGRSPAVLQVVRWHRTRPVVHPPSSDVVAARVADLVAAGRPDRAIGNGTGNSGAPWWSPSWSDLDPVLDRGAHDLVAVVVGDVAGGDVVAIADDLLGHGPGSTPSGDDLLAGFIATCQVLDPMLARRVGPVADHVVRVAHARTTALSATLLACAVDGAMALPAAGFLQALLAPHAGPDRTAAAFDHLARIGHTSGHDLALGILAATVAHTRSRPVTAVPRTRDPLAVTVAHGTLDLSSTTGSS